MNRCHSERSATVYRGAKSKNPEDAALTKAAEPFSTTYQTIEAPRIPHPRYRAGPSSFPTANPQRSTPRLASLRFPLLPASLPMRLRSSSLLLALCLITAAARSQQTGWQPTPGHPQLPIWPGAIPDAAPVLGPEVVQSVVPTNSSPAVASPAFATYPPHHDHLLPGRQKHRRRRRRLPRRRLPDARHRSRRHRGLRLARRARHHRRRAQVPRPRQPSARPKSPVPRVPHGA